MRRLLVKLDEPLASDTNNRLVHDQLIKIVAKYGAYTRGLHWEYTRVFSLVFPYIIDRLMGWDARPSRSTDKRLLVRLASREKPLIDIWWG